MLRSFFIFLTLLHSFNSTFADENAVVNLFSQLSTSSKLQRGGTCHIYAAADLFEAACFRTTGKHIRISELYLTYKHIKSQLEEGNRQPLIDRKKRVGLVTDLDAGYPENDLNNILRGDVCSRDQSENESHFYDFLIQFLDSAQKKAEQDDLTLPTSSGMVSGTAIGGGLGSGIGLLLGKAILEFHQYESSKNNSCIGKFEKLATLFTPALLGGVGTAVLGYKETRVNEIEKPYTDKLITQMEVAINKAMKRNFSQNADLKECLSKNFKVKSMSASHSEMQSLLKSGVPFICSGRFSDELVSHSAIVLGYKIDSTSPGGFSYLVRNANNGAPSWFNFGSSGCEKITILNNSDKD